MVVSRLVREDDDGNPVEAGSNEEFDTMMSWDRCELVETIQNLDNKNYLMRDLLQDLNVILPTALHNGHHDLIQRVKEICDGR